MKPRHRAPCRPHHDVELEDETGRRLARARLPEGIEGITRLHALMAGHLPEEWADPGTGAVGHRVHVGIETDRGPWVQALLAAGYRVYAINPMSAARYRERHSTSGAKCDAGDAHVLAEIVRLDRRPSPADRRGQPGRRGDQGRRPRAPDADLGTHPARPAAALRAAGVLPRRAGRPSTDPGLTDPDALELLGRAPDPAGPPGCPGRRIAAALKRPAAVTPRPRPRRSRRSCAPRQLRQPRRSSRPTPPSWPARSAFITALNSEIAAMQEVVAEHFGRHPDAEIYPASPASVQSSAPGCSAEFGDDPHRYADAKARKNYAGTSPITRASGKKTVVLARYARNHRLGDALHQWAFCALHASPGARAYYDNLRARGTGHHAALRQLGNRLVGILHGCLKTHTTYDEATAWGHHPSRRCLTPKPMGCLTASP